VAGRAPGSATSAPLSVKGRSDKAVPYPKWRALVRGHARARPRGAPAKRAGARLPLKARALYVTVLRTPASGDPGLQLRRGPAGRLRRARRRRHAARSVDSIPGAPHADPTPRQAGPAVGHGRRHGRRAACFVRTCARGVTAEPSAAAKPGRGGEGGTSDATSSPTSRSDCRPRAGAAWPGAGGPTPEATSYKPQTGRSFG
jgi:hypothetical protein